MMADSGTQKRIQKRLNRMERLFTHLAVTLVITLGIVYGVEYLGIPAQTEDAIIPIVVLLFIAHALWVMSSEAKHFIIQQETGQASSSYNNEDEEKPKRLLALDDDGELTEIIDDAIDWDEKVENSE